MQRISSWSSLCLILPQTQSLNNPFIPFQGDPLPFILPSALKSPKICVIQQYNQSRQEMSEGHIQAKIREYLLSARENPASQLLRHFPLKISELTADLPMLPLHQIKAICKAQEQAIIEKIIPIKPYDLYEEIAKVCPDEKDIRTISSDEVAIRVGLYNSKLVLHEKMTCESESEDSWEESKGESFFGEVQFDEVCMMDNANEEHTMRNIFEQCDNQQNNWGTSEYFGLS